MKLGSPINVRLTPRIQYKLEAEAAAQDMPLSSYLREKLESDNIKFETKILEKIDNISQLIGSDTSLSKNNNESMNIGIMLEILLLLRQIVPPQKIQLAQQEIKRAGYTVWVGKDEQDYESRR